MVNDRRTVAILAPDAADPQSLALRDAVRALGGRARMLPMRMLRRNRPVELSVGEDALVFDEALEDAGAIFLRGLALNVPAAAPPLASAVEAAALTVRYERERIRQQVVRAFCHAAAARGTLVVNPPETYYHHDTKPQLYRALHRAGIVVPDSIGTNEMAQAAARAGTGVFKAGLGVGSTRAFATTLLDREAELRTAPALFQERIDGATLRIHTVGDRVVLALRVHHASLDSRTAMKRIEPVHLDEAHERMLARANALLGIHFAAWDGILSEGGLVLVDCNPGPYMGWITEPFMRIVLTEVARFLLAWCDTGELDAARAAVQPAIVVAG